MANAALWVVRTINPGNIPRLDVISLDGSVLAFTFGVSVLTGLLFGLAPALRTGRSDLSGALKAGGRNTQGDAGLGGRRRRLRSVLVAAEVAVSIMLLIAAGLLLRSFVRLQQVSPGFEAEGVISMRLGPGTRQFPDRAGAMAYAREFGEKIAALPGVVSRGAVSSLPFTSSVGWTFLNVEGWTPQPGQELQTDQRSATTDYFRTMRIPLVQGRFFTDTDLMPDAEPVVVIDDRFAQRFWPNGDALGKHVWNDPQRRMKIVGVVGMVKQYGLDVEPRIVMYSPAPNGQWQVIRTSSDPDALAPAIIRAIHDLDPGRTVFDVRTMSDRRSDSLARQRFATLMLGAFALFALLLAIVGVYGVLSHLVAQGRHDIGVRMALGADRWRIVRMVVRQGMELTLAGVVLGLLGALALTRVMSALLFGVGARDFMTFALVPLMLIAVALLASFLPARRATRVNPVVALRDE
jgi:putative ABC transport system permease protein